MQKENSSIPDDEIDIRSIGKKVYSFFAYPVSLLLHNIKTTLLFVLAAILLAVALKYALQKTYKSSFIIRPSDPHEKFHLKALKDLQTLLKTQDYSTLATELKAGPDLVAALKELEVSSPTYKASPDSINYTEVTVITSDYKQFIPIQTSLVNYLENNPYFLKIKMLQGRQVGLAMEQVNRDLPQLDSLKSLQLKNYENQNPAGQNALLMNELVDPTSVYKMSIDRLTKKSVLMAQQVFSDNFQVIKSCVEVKRPNWPPRILIMCLVLVPVFLLLCILFLHLKTRKRAA